MSVLLFNQLRYRVKACYAKQKKNLLFLHVTASSHLQVKVVLLLSEECTVASQY